MTIWFSWVCLSVTFALRCMWFPGSNFRHPKLEFPVELTLRSKFTLCVLIHSLPLIPHPSHGWGYFIPLGSSQQIPALMLPQVPDLSLHTDTATGPSPVRAYLIPGKNLSCFVTLADIHSHSWKSSNGSTFPVRITSSQVTASLSRTVVTSHMCRHILQGTLP